jgi:Rrf2 family protein
MQSHRVLLKRDESYAIHAMAYIAENPGTNAARIAEDLAIPPAFTAKVLRKLVTAGLISSQMGRTGGVQLIVAPNEVSLLDIIEVISGPLIVDTCQVRHRCATQQRKGHCRVKLAWLATSTAIRETFKGVTLDQLVDPLAGETAATEERPA